MLEALMYGSVAPFNLGKFASYVEIVSRSYCYSECVVEPNALFGNSSQLRQQNEGWRKP